MRWALAAALAAVAAGGVLLIALGGGEPARDPVIVSVAEPTATGAGEVATGFAVGPARIVTVAHILDADLRPVVRMATGQTRAARVLRVDPRSDLALLEVPGLAADRLRAAEAGDGEALLLVRRRGKVVRMPAGIRRHVNATVHLPDAPTYRRPALELEANVVRGDSGAPVVDDSGAVAGVVFARANDRPATAYAVDASAVRALLR